MIYHVHVRFLKKKCKKREQRKQEYFYIKNLHVYMIFSKAYNFSFKKNFQLEIEASF